MLRHRSASILILLFALAAQTAHAFIDPPWITPADPRAGETVSVNIRMGVCDVTAERPGYPQVTQEGGAIRILIYGHHWDESELCIWGVGTSTEALGAFPPGDYTLTVDFVYDNYPDGYATVTLGVIPFTVMGAPPAAPVPALHPFGFFSLMALLSGFGVWILRMQRRTSG